MTKFELLLVLKPDIAEAEVKTELDEIKQSIGALKGKVASEENWGKRELSYPIKHFREGIYVVLVLTLPVEGASVLAKQLGLRRAVVRFLLTKLGNSSD